MKKMIIFLIVILISVFGFKNFILNRNDFQKEVYNIVISDEFKIPYEFSDKNYFENGFNMGVGSGITFKGYNENGEMEFYVITDRGPVSSAPNYLFNNNTMKGKIFLTPNFSPTICTVTIKENSAFITDTIQLKNSDNSKTTGLPIEIGQIGSTGEIPLDINLNFVGFDNQGIDPEGIAVDSDGNFWICDEYGPFLIKANSEGVILEKYSPEDFLPGILVNRIENRGFEGLTITPSGKIIISLQSVLDVNGDTRKNATFIRFIEFDPNTKLTRTFAYPIDTDDFKSSKNCKIGDIYSVDDTTLLVIEQGDLASGEEINKIYKVDLSNATDITNLDYNGKALEYATDKDDLNIEFIQKELFIDLREYGWTLKAEGICMVDDNTIVIINDNDFGIDTEIYDDGAKVDITRYVYDPETGLITLKGEEKNPQLFISESKDLAQIWFFKINKDLIGN